MHPQQRQQLRREIRCLISYAKQFGIPHSQLADEIERKVRIQITPTTTDAEYLAFKAEVRQLIESMLSEQ
jgi:hypothetical protein